MTHEDYVCPQMNMRINASSGENCWFDREGPNMCPHCPRRESTASKCMDSVEALEKILKDTK
jgi:hypothetical protein